MPDYVLTSREAIRAMYEFAMPHLAEANMTNIAAGSTTRR